MLPRLCREIFLARLEHLGPRGNFRHRDVPPMAACLGRLPWIRVDHHHEGASAAARPRQGLRQLGERCELEADRSEAACMSREVDRKSTRLNSSHVSISYAVFCLKKKISR